MDSVVYCIIKASKTGISKNYRNIQTKNRKCIKILRNALEEEIQINDNLAPVKAADRGNMYERKYHHSKRGYKNF